MIRQRIYLERWDWVIYAYYSVGHYYTYEIMNKLHDIGCRGMNLVRAHANLVSGNLDTGLTYSNKERRRSVMVVGTASSGRELFNSILHEMRHVEEHIVMADGLEPYGEDVAYLTGELGMEIYRSAGKLLCDCCRKHLVKKRLAELE